MLSLDVLKAFDPGEAELCCIPSMGGQEGILVCTGSLGSATAQPASEASQNSLGLALHLPDCRYLNQIQSTGGNEPHLLIIFCFSFDIYS